MKEEQAITLLKQGNLNGLEELVRCHQAKAVRAAFLIVGDRFAAEDITSDAFLKAATKIHQFKDGRPFRPWFMRIVINAAKDAASREKRQTPLDDLEESGRWPTFLDDEDSDPEGQAVSAEERHKVWQALMELSPKQRAAIVRRYFLNMHDREIADVLNRSLSSIKWSLHTGKERLRLILEPDDGQGHDVQPK